MAMHLAVGSVCSDHVDSFDEKEERSDRIRRLGKPKVTPHGYGTRRLNRLNASSSFAHFLKLPGRKVLPRQNTLHEPDSIASSISRTKNRLGVHHLRA